MENFEPSVGQNNQRRRKQRQEERERDPGSPRKLLPVEEDYEEEDQEEKMGVKDRFFREMERVPCSCLKEGTENGEIR